MAREKKAQSVWAVTAITTIGVFVAVIVAGDLLRAKGADASIEALPRPNRILAHSAEYSAPMLKALKIDPKNPLHLEFVIDAADKAAVTKDDAAMLVRYFLAGLTLPGEDLWVNLSPYEKDRVVPDALGATDLGNQMLAQDYVLKQIAASFTAPTDRVGKMYWKELNSRIAQLTGTAAAPVDTFNKIWVVPQKATVYESNNIAAIEESGLDVMLEHDYLAASKNQATSGNDASAEAAKSVLREKVIPAISDEVNRGAHFAPLRQMFSALILAKWFKAKVQNSFYRAYVDRSKTAGVDTVKPADNKAVFDRYVLAFEKGCYDYLRKQVDPGTGKMFARRYFSGGINGDTQVSGQKVTKDEMAVALHTIKGRPAVVAVDLTKKMMLDEKRVAPGATAQATTVATTSAVSDIVSDSVQKAVQKTADTVVAGKPVATIQEAEKAEVAQVAAATADAGVKKEDVGGIDLKSITVEGISGVAPVEMAPVDMQAFAGFDFEITALERYKTPEAMLASFI
jgi:hypothetical protein